jgi:hypothetical protein
MHTIVCTFVHIVNAHHNDKNVCPTIRLSRAQLGAALIIAKTRSDVTTQGVGFNRLLGASAV